MAKAIGGGSFPASAVLLGSIAPDIPLYLLSAGSAAWFRFWEGRPWSEVGRHMYGYLFYNDPVWITLHNFLHSPLVLVVALAVTFFAIGGAEFFHSWWTWFFASCLLHTIFDIPVHHDDGPLVFWPLNWNYRFASPISYWDPSHYGRILIPLELTLAIFLAVRLVYQWFRGNVE